MIYDLLSNDQRQRLENEWELDFSYALPRSARFRVNVYFQRGAIGAAFRTIPSEIKSISELGLPKAVEELTEKPRGLVLVTGPTGSGKSTTLAAMIDKINETRHEHIMEAGPDEKPIIRLVSSVLQHAVGDGASDIHIEPQAREVTVRFRVDGVLREVMSIPPKLQHSVTARVKLLAELNIAEKRLPQDGRFSVKLDDQKIDFRVASLPTAYGEKIVLRLLDTANVEADLGKLGFEQRDYERFEAVFRRPYGATLVTGPTGSGKSTTLYATLRGVELPGEEHHNRRGPCRVQDTRPQPGADQPQGSA